MTIALIATTAFAAMPPSRGGTAGTSPQPSRPIESGTATPSPPVDPQVVSLLRSLNEQLVAYGAALQAERERGRFRTPEVANLIRQVNAQVAVGSQAVSALDGALGKDAVGGRLAALYGEIADTANKTLDASIQNETAYKTGAGVIVRLIADLPGLQAELDALLEQPPSALPSSAPPSSPPPASAPPSAGPPSPSGASPTPAPTSQPSPSAAPGGSPSPTTSAGPTPAGEQIENGGFEAGVGQPWGLFLAADAVATLSADTSSPGAGSTSARVETADGGSAYSGISLRQADLVLEAGRLYTLDVAVRAAIDREIRVRVASTDGASYVNRVVAVGTAWSTVSITFIAGASDPKAVLALDLGRSDGTMWFDSVSFRPIGA